MLLLKVLFNKKESLADRVILAKQDSQERERLIIEYKPFIKNVISREKGAFIDDNCDEWSIGLIAFNEAIDRFDSEKSNSFIHIAELVIKSRIIDYIRKEISSAKSLPISYIEENSEIEGFEEKYLVDKNDPMNDEIKEEMTDFSKELGVYGITIEDLADCCPKHRDARVNAVNIAKKIYKDELLSKKLLNTKRLPIVELMNLLGISRKILETNRKYIIAVYVILKSDNSIIKGYIKNLTKGDEDDE